MRPAEALGGAAALGLLAAMTLADWYGGANAWQAFAALDLLLLATAALGLALAALTATRRSPALPVAVALVLVPVGVLVTLAVLYRVLDPPGDGPVEAGAWLGLAAASLVTVAAWLSLRDDSPPRRAQGPVDVPVRPAPPA